MADCVPTVLAEPFIFRPVQQIRLGMSIDMPQQTIIQGIDKESIEGNPSPPCLRLRFPSKHAFRWGVTTGAHTLKIDTKQVSNVTAKRPRVTVKANPSIGVPNDVYLDAGAGTGWMTVGPISVTATDNGVLIVELENRDDENWDSPAYFDNLVRT